MLAARLIKRKTETRKEDTAATDDPHLSEASKKREFTLANSKTSTVRPNRKRAASIVDRSYLYVDAQVVDAHRWAIVLLSALVILSTIPLFMFVGKNFLPVDDQSQFEVNWRTPEGSTLSSTAALNVNGLPPMCVSCPSDRYAGDDWRRPATDRQSREHIREADSESKSATRRKSISNVARCVSEILARYQKEFPDQLRTSLNAWPQFRAVAFATGHTVCYRRT